ncbi:MAG: xylulokinase [Clostridia bacterium]|nr:xylulokinase [Clostridia bacterium]
MTYYIGIDLGTSAMKIVLTDAYGTIFNTVTKEYPLSFPNPNWCEQSPRDWITALVDGTNELLNGFDASKIAGIGCAGQMHGLVVLDDVDNVIRPAILWNDGRTFKEVDYLNNIIGKNNLLKWTGNVAFAGFTAPKLIWLKNNEPSNFSKIAKVMLPKDYVNYTLTGVFSSDYSDASGTLLLDVANKQWSKEMLTICNITEEQMPTLYESYAPIGKVLPNIAKLLGIPNSVTVCAGAGDNAAAAVGAGIVDGECNISIGTSGTVFISSKTFSVDNNNALHSFAHADGKYHLMGCMLSAASCNKWLMENVFQTSDYKAEQELISYDDLGENKVYFLPYLMGERSPINDTNARGTFIGITLDTKRSDLTQAVLEGIAFAIRDIVEVARSLGIKITTSKICGGGAKSKLLKQIISNVLNVNLEENNLEQGPSIGASILAMIACGEYDSVKTACNKLTSVTTTVKPNAKLVEKYEIRYKQFKHIYPALKETFTKLI